MTNLSASPSPDERSELRPPDLSDELEAAARRRAAADDGRTMVLVEFTLPADVHATTASVVGDFNSWEPSDGVMTRDEAGAFSCSLPIPSGRTYQYRFLLDGERWTNDWAAHSYAPNSFGGEDSVLDLTDPDLGGAPNA